MIKKLAPIIFVLLVISSILAGYIYAKNSAGKKVDFHTIDYTGAQKCKDCHQENYNSWYETYHRTMTQEANDESVLGDFDGSHQTYWGFTISPVIKNDKYFFDYYDPQTGNLLNSLEIKRTVGSRIYQQYLAQTNHTGGNYYRLELLWHIEDKRWVHLNGAFLGNDNQSFDKHTAIWNQNCIFCHNTGINPNMTNYDEIIEKTKSGQALNLKVDSRFDSHVSDLGIGCESCHANGEKHIELSKNPLRKYYLHYTDAQDKSIVNPRRLSHKKSMDICGQCHGQRTPKTYNLARHWMEKGPTYRPGDDLQKHVNPVWKETQINNYANDIFSLRFWPDGTPRLSAYEYQGVLQSACHEKGELSCSDCHSMHEGNPKGMITDKNLTNTACYQCHKTYEKNLAEHTGHKNDSQGSLCYDCHMPKIVYGVMTLHRSHKIESPNPLSEFNNNKPNACLSCHNDKSARWVFNSFNQIWPDSVNTISNNTELEIDHLDEIKSLVILYSADPVERSVAAFNLANDTLNNRPNDNQLYLIPHLLFAMEDNYPAIRRFSFKSLMAIINEYAQRSDELNALKSALKSYDFIADIAIRNILLKQAWHAFNVLDKSQWPVVPQGAMMDDDYKLNITKLLTLRSLSQTQNKTIDIGE